MKFKNSIPECMRYSVGIEIYKENLRITENCKIPIFLYLSLKNINKTNMMQIRDIVCINENEEFNNFTEKFPKGLDIHYELKNNEEEKESEENVKYPINVRITRHLDKKVDEKFIYAGKRKEHQEELLKKKMRI